MNCEECRWSSNCACGAVCHRHPKGVLPVALVSAVADGASCKSFQPREALSESEASSLRRQTETAEDLALEVAAGFEMPAAGKTSKTASAANAERRPAKAQRALGIL